MRAAALPRGFLAVLTAGYSTLAIRLLVRVEPGGYDLGVFQQEIRNYAALHAPIVDLKKPVAICSATISSDPRDHRGVPRTCCNSNADDDCSAPDLCRDSGSLGAHIWDASLTWPLP